MTQEEMKGRTKQYGLRVIKAVRALDTGFVGRALGAQFLRAGTSVGANYRAACRAKATADFINKLKIVEEECDESLYWMEMLVESGLVKTTRLSALMKEGDEIIAIVVSSIKASRMQRA